MVRAYPFTVNITFRGSCLFRSQADNKDIIEDYFLREIYKQLQHKMVFAYGCQMQMP